MNLDLDTPLMKNVMRNRKVTWKLNSNQQQPARIRTRKHTLDQQSYPSLCNKGNDKKQYKEK